MLVVGRTVAADGGCDRGKGKGVANSKGELYMHVQNTESDYDVEFMKPLHGPAYMLWMGRPRTIRS